MVMRTAPRAVINELTTAYGRSIAALFFFWSYPSNIFLDNLIVMTWFYFFVFVLVCDL